MLESVPNGDYDIKVPYKNVGALLNGKYATSRSAENYLAGKNAATSDFGGAKVSFDGFHKQARKSLLHHLDMILGEEY